MGWKQVVAGVLNVPLGAVGLSAVPRWTVQWWTAAGAFTLWGRQHACFYHSLNCGWPPYATERCVELALADAWLRDGPAEGLVEIGAVTPYYWPRRVAVVVDPFDPHPAVTDRRSLFDIDLAGRHVLSISTLEHVGTGDYGSTEPPELAAEAFRKVFAEAGDFLITVPVGYNPRTDAFVFGKDTVPADVRVGFLVRAGVASWRQESDPDRARLPYGDAELRKRFPGTTIGGWANSVAVLERGRIVSAGAGGV
jgi:hypothetical protein